MYTLLQFFILKLIQVLLSIFVLCVQANTELKSIKYKWMQSYFLSI